MAELKNSDNTNTLMDYYFKEYVRLTEQKKTASQAATSAAGFSLVFQSTMFLIHLETMEVYPLVLAHLVVMSLFCYIVYLQNNIDAIHLSLGRIERRFNQLSGEDILTWSHDVMKEERFNILESMIITVVLVVFIEFVLLLYTIFRLSKVQDLTVCLTSYVLIGLVASISIFSLIKMLKDK